MRLRMLGVAVGLIGLVACSGGDAGETTTEPVGVEVSTDRMTDAWPAQLATVESFADYQSSGWVTFVQNRNYRQAAEQLGGDSGRAHAEAAAIFRSAALVLANSAIETYAQTPQETDPVGVSHLLAVGYALNGELEKARAASARLDGVEDVTTPWHAPWKAWLSGDASWPPDLSALPVELPAPAAGTWPELVEVPHYRMPVQAEGDHKVPMGDPGALVMLAMWHEAAAKTASDPKQVDTYLARYRWNAEPDVAGVDLDMEFLYASDMLVAADGPFLVDLMGEKGAAAVEAHADKSLTAHLAIQARKDGKVNAESAVDVATALRTAILAKTKADLGGNTERHHRLFADMAEAGLLRNLALVAAAEGDREEEGKLRLLAKDATHDHTGCAVPLMQLAAWDAGNRYPSRAQEIIHRNTRFYPSLEVARYGLDVLALRVGHERVETPGM